MIWLSILIGMPLVIAGPIYLLRRFQKVSAWGAALVILALVWVAWQAPVDTVFVLLGRTLRYSVLDHLALPWILLLTGMLLAFSGSVPQGWSNAPFTLVSVGILTVALVLENLTLAMVFLLAGSILNTFLIQSGRHGSTRNAMAFLGLTVLTLPPMALGGWLTEFMIANPGDTNAPVLAVFCLALGFGSLLSIVPLHLRLTAIGEEAPPAVLGLAVVTAQTVGLVRLVEILLSANWLRQTNASELLIMGGLITALAAAAMSLPQPNLGRILAHSATSDLGAILIALGVGSPVALLGALLMVLSRAVAVTLLAITSAIFRYYIPGDEVSLLQGISIRLPGASIGLVIGALALGGFPGFSGFPGRWLVYQAAFEVNPVWGYGMMIANALILANFFRLVRVTYYNEPVGQGSEENRVTLLILAVIIILVLILGVVPFLFVQPLVEVLRMLRVLP
ncbi:MAG: hypothetical protein EXR62_15905 [Chloroflexi bacterium]|nr:hypothetical protein [Chloroflexota bacterium]